MNYNIFNYCSIRLQYIILDLYTLIYIEILPIHLVRSSPLPILVSINILCMIISVVLIISGINNYMEIYRAILFIIMIIIIWIYDIIIESVYNGMHTYLVVYGIYLAFILFIGTEIALFSSIFASVIYIYLHINIGLVIPISIVDPYIIALLGTIILFTSSISITVSHYAFIGIYRHITIDYIGISIIKGIYFIILLIYEYSIGSNSINDSIYASIFYIATGLHGMHIIIGITILIVIYNMMCGYMIDNYIYSGYIVGIIYWHFVDVIWGIIFMVIYIWPVIIIYLVE